MRPCVGLRGFEREEVRNSDQKVQPEELKFYTSPSGPGGLFSIYLDTDHSFAGDNVTGGRYSAPSLDAKGVPTLGGRRLLL